MRLTLAAALLGALVGQPAQARAQGGQPGPRVSAEEYEGWRQYSVHCARCHGQDVLGNPVAANLLESVREGGPMAARSAFVVVVQGGRPQRGMPALGQVISGELSDAIYAYVKGRADGRIAAGRPTRAYD